MNNNREIIQLTKELNCLYTQGSHLKAQLIQHRITVLKAGAL